MKTMKAPKQWPDVSGWLMAQTGPEFHCDDVRRPEPRTTRLWNLEKMARPLTVAAQILSSSVDADRRRRAGTETVTPRDLPKVMRARLRRPLLRLAIDSHQSKLGPVAVNPLVVVEQRPVDVAAHVDAVGETIL